MSATFKRASAIRLLFQSVGCLKTHDQAECHKMRERAGLVRNRWGRVCVHVLSIAASLDDVVISRV